MVMDIILPLILLATILIPFVMMWMIFAKAGQPGWAGIVPIYNGWILVTKITGNSALWFVLAFVPIIQFFAALKIHYDLALSFGKGMGFFLGMIFLPFIFYPLLAFGGAQYQGAPH